MRYRYYTADVFTDRIFGGNPLAVFPDARGVPEARMQQVAREFNISETVFVLPPESGAHTRRLRIFTPAAELPFAGHPTVGCAYVLAAIGDVQLAGEETRIVFEEGAGPVPVSIRAAAGRPVFTQLTAPRPPEAGPPPPALADIAAALSLPVADLAGGDWAPQAFSCGNPFLFVPLRDRGVLARARIDHAKWAERIASYWASSLFIFSRDPERPGADVRARMYPPALGIAEDSATVSAAAAITGYLAARAGTRDGMLRWVIEQGVEMGRPSVLEVEADVRAGKVVAARVGGASVLVTEGTMEIPA